MAAPSHDGDGNAAAEDDAKENNDNTQNDDDGDADSLIEGYFSLNLNVNVGRGGENGGGGNDSDDDVTATSEVTWLTYRDEKCAEVKEEFIKRLKLATRSNNNLTIEDRKSLLQTIVEEQRLRDLAEKEERRKRTEARRMSNLSDAYSDSEESEEDTSDGDDESLSGQKGAIFGGTGALALDVVKEETLADLRESSRGNSTSKDSITSEENSQGNSPSHSNHHNNSNAANSSMLSPLNQEHIDMIVNLKLLVANQQTMVDALASKLHKSQLQISILQSENQILKKNIGMQQQQLIAKPREAFEALHNVSSSPENNNNQQEKFTIASLSSKLQKMAQVNNVLMREKMQLQREITLLKKNGDCDNEGANAAAAVEVKGGEETKTLSADTTPTTRIPMTAPNQAAGAIFVAPADVHSKSTSGGEKQLVLHSRSHIQFPYIQKKNELSSLPSDLVAPRELVPHSPPILSFPRTTPGAQLLQAKENSEPRSTSGHGSSSEHETSISREEGVEVGGKRILGQKLLSRFGFPNPLSRTTMGQNSIRVQDLSNELIPLVGTPKFCVMLYNVLSPEECSGLIKRVKREQFEELSYYRRGSEGGSANISSCKRCRLRDADLAVDLLERISTALEGTALEQRFRTFSWSPLGSISSGSVSGDGRSESGVESEIGPNGTKSGTLTRINQLFNVLRYDVGEFFAPHCDNTVRTGTEISRVTLQIFLNEKFSGGATSIREGKKFFDVKPKVGSILLVDQELRREECYVVTGKKYLIRADIMYDEKEYLGRLTSENVIRTESGNS